MRATGRGGVGGGWGVEEKKGAGFCRLHCLPTPETNVPGPRPRLEIATFQPQRSESPRPQASRACPASPSRAAEPRPRRVFLPYIASATLPLPPPFFFIYSTVPGRGVRGPQTSFGGSPPTPRIGNGGERREAAEGNRALRRTGKKRKGKGRGGRGEPHKTLEI